MDDFTERTYRHIEAAARRIDDEKLGSHPTILRSLLLEKKLTFGEIFTFTSDLILAGVDTTAFAATCLLFQLARNQEAQKKVRQEFQATVQEKSGFVVPEQLDNMPFLKACLKESLRLNPPSPGIYRLLDHDVVMSGYVVPAGVPIFIDYYVAGRVTENFDNPELFLPERWLKMQRSDLHSDRYASLPFSFGPRMCPGRTIAELQLCLLVSKILLKYKVHCEKEDIGFHRRLGNVPNDSVDFSFEKLP
ncbi:probable cytochrome P450 12b2, mitochondrial [Rhipicephalus sanguineus]|uniref:probable cytochrome P450 12b2, mitochondrial n=1 Tax=Rhipicephalus sanguineus TaxID=34632 RepID=UPI0020C49EC0|nr:probable cytochrome P450 12b2, mitochondrial [Rhipicephalus sanguineus]